MSEVLRIVLIVVSVISLFYVLRKISHSKLQIEYALFWILCAIFLVILAVFPQIVYAIADLLGVMSPANVIFVIIIAILLLKVFMMTIELSQLERKFNEIAERMALDEKKREKEKKEI